MGQVLTYLNNSSAGGNGTTPGEAGATAAYATEAAWQSAESTDLVADMDTHLLLCTAGSLGTAEVGQFFLSGVFNSDATYNLTIEPYNDPINGDQRSVHTWDNTIFRCIRTNQTAGPFDLREDYTTVRGIQQRLVRTDTSSSAHDVMRFVGQNNRMVDCRIEFVYSRATNRGFQVRMVEANDPGNVCENVALVCYATVANTFGVFEGFMAGGADRLACYNCTVRYVSGASGTKSVYRSYAANGLLLRNCLGEGPSTVWNSGGGWKAGTDYNSASAGTATGGGNDRVGQSFAWGAGTRSTLLSDADGGARNFGEDLSGLGFSADMVGTARPQGPEWDIGCSEASEPAVVPSVTTVSAVDTEASGIDATGDITSTGGDPIIDRGFYVGLSSPPTTKVSEGGTATGVYSDVLASLGNGQQHYVRAYAENGVGEGLGTILLVTPTDVPAITTDSLVDQFFGEVLATATISADNGQPILDRGFYIDTFTPPTTQVSEGGTSTGVYQDTFVGQIGVLHYVRAYATNSVGEALGDILTITPADAPVVFERYGQRSWTAFAEARISEARPSRNWSVDQD